MELTLRYAATQRWVFARVAGSDHMEVTQDPQVQLFAEELGDQFMIRSYSLSDLPQGDWTVEELVDMTIANVERKRDLRPTLAYVNGASLILVYIKDQGQPRPWSDLSPYEKQMATKLMKRLSIFGWRERLQAKFDADEFSVVSEEEDDLEDGISFIRTETFLELVEGDKEARAQVMTEDERFKCRRFHMRITTDIGLIKGDFLLVDNLDSDIVVNDHNVCKELWTSDGVVRAMAFAQGQCKPALSNIQLLNYFYQVFWHEEDLMRSLRIDMLRHFYRVRRGEAPEHVLDTLGATSEEEHDEDAALGVEKDKERESVIPNSTPVIRELNDSFEELGVPKNVSPRLVQYAAQGALDTLMPPVVHHDGEADGQYQNKEDRARYGRRFTLPFAFMVSLTSEKAARRAGYKGHLKRGQIDVDKDIGLIVPDAEYPEIAKILGGGDQDDKVIVGLVRNSKTGSVHVVLVRNPIGLQSDGVSYGVEYVRRIPKPRVVTMLVERERKRYESANVISDFSEDLIPEYDPALLPTVATKINPETGIEFTQDEIGDAYTMDFVKEKSKVASQAAAAYGTHCLLNMAAYNAGVALSPVGPEDQVIDACTQYYVARDVDQLVRMNTLNTDELAGHKFDKALYVRLPWDIRSPQSLQYASYVGPLTQLMDKYNKMVTEQFVPAARKVIKDSLESTQQKLIAQWPEYTEAKPLLLKRINAAQARLRRDRAGLTAREFAQAADMVVAEWRKSFSDDNLFHASLMDQVRRSLVYNTKYARFKEQSSNLKSCVVGADTPLMNGALADYTIKVYQELLSDV